MDKIQIDKIDGFSVSSVGHETKYKMSLPALSNISEQINLIIAEVRRFTERLPESLHYNLTDRCILTCTACFNKQIHSAELKTWSTPTQNQAEYMNNLNILTT